MGSNVEVSCSFNYSDHCKIVFSTQLVFGHQRHLQRLILNNYRRNKIEKNTATFNFCFSPTSLSQFWIIILTRISWSWFCLILPFTEIVTECKFKAYLSQYVFSADFTYFIRKATLWYSQCVLQRSVLITEGVSMVVMLCFRQ